MGLISQQPGNLYSSKRRLLRLLTRVLPFTAAFVLPLSVQAQDVGPTIMPVGDSITAGWQQPSYRRALYKDLQNAGCDVNMVGDQTLSSFLYNKPGEYPGEDFPSLAGFNPPYPAGATWSVANAADDTDHQGFGGIQAQEIATGVSSVQPIATYVNNEQPDYVLLHAGTNDLSQALKKPDRTVERFVQNTSYDLRTIIKRVQESQPTAQILLGNFIPRAKEDAGSAQGERERQMSVALTQEIDEKFPGLSNVTVVDVESGFNSATMTTDGVHPNALGEQHIADAFREALLDLGLCDNTGGPDPTPLPTHTINKGEWSLISIPADPGPSGTVQALFADDIDANKYGSDGEWVVYAFDAVQGKYKELALSDTLAANKGYWIIQDVTDSIVLDLPSSLTPLAGGDLPGCPTDNCVSADLVSNASKAQWNLVGISTLKSVTFENTRFQTANPVCDSGCTPAQAETNNLVSNEAHRYRSGYQEMSAGDKTQPWDGIWIEVRSNAQSPKWVVPR